MIAYVSVTDELGIWSRIKKPKNKGKENEISVQIPKECTFTGYSVLYLNIKLDPFKSTVSICYHDSSLLLSGIGSQNQMQTKVSYILDDVFTVGVGELGTNGIHLCVLLFLNIF